MTQVTHFNEIHYLPPFPLPTPDPYPNQYHATGQKKSNIRQASRHNSQEQAFFSMSQNRAQQRPPVIRSIVFEL